MNLATRCTTCGTIFRVVQDQLRVSEGWVRCGRCAEVFDAREQLFDLERDSPPPWPPQASAPPPATRQATRQAALPSPPVQSPMQAPVQAPVQAPYQPPYQQPSQQPPYQAPHPAPYPAPYPPTSQPPAPAYQPPPSGRPQAPMDAVAQGYATRPGPNSAPTQGPEAPTTVPSRSMAAAFDDLPRRVPPAPIEPPRDSGWLANDDNELNPFAPSRPLPGDFGDDDEDSLLPSPRHYSRPRSRTGVSSSQAQGPGSSLESSYGEERVEPFLSAAPTADPRSHLPEPKGMRFEEDELPPPVTDDDRPDVLLALSPATAAQLKSQEPSLDPRVPVHTPIDPGEPSLMPSTAGEVPLSRAERKAAEKAAAETARRAKLDAKAAEKAAEKAAKDAEKEARDAEKEAARAAKEAEKLALETKKAAEKAAKAEARIKERQAAADAAAMPSFVRKAESAQRWHRPWVRATLGTAALGLLVGVGGQVVWQGREAIAAQYPVARPMLLKMTTAMGQELKPWQHIEALSVESSSLNPAGEGNHYRLSLSLRNRSNWDVAQPWLDLSLTDASGQLVVRRMLSPEELRATSSTFTAGGDQQLQVVFDSGNTKISGYTVELFYP